MTNKTLDEIAASIAHLHSIEFGDRSSGNYLLSREDFRQLAGRAKIQKSIFAGVADELRAGFGLLLVDTGECYAVLESARISRLRSATSKGIRAQAGRVPSTATTAARTVLAPAAQWPFPTSSRP